MKAREKKAIKGFYTSIIQYLIIFLLQLILTPVILKKAGQDVLGAYVVLMQIIGYSLLIDFGISTSFGRYLTQSIKNGLPEKNFSEIFNVGRYLFLAINILTGIFVVIFAININLIIVSDTNIANQAFIGLILLSVWGVLKAPLIVYNQGLISTENMSTSNIILTVSGIIRTLLSFVSLLFEYVLVTLVLANIISELISLLMQRYYFNSKYKLLELKWKIPNLLILKEILYFGFTYWGINIFIVLTTGSDSLLVGSIYGVAAASIYYTTKIPSTIVTQVIYKITDNVSSAANQLIGMGELGGVRKIYLNLIRYSLILAIPFAVGVIGYNKVIIDMWVGNNQYAGNLMTISLALFLLTQVLNHVNAMIYLSIGNHMHKWMYLSFINGLITISLAYIFGKIYGLEYIMLIIALMDLPIMIFLFYKSCIQLKISRYSICNESIIPALKSSFLIFLWMVYVMIEYNLENIPDIIFSVILFIFLWLIGVCTSGINNTERSYIKSMIFDK